MDSKSIKILILEDDIQLLYIMKTKFEMEGYKVFSSNKVRTAKKLVAEELPDIVICDLLLHCDPDGSGHDFIKWLHEERVECFITAISQSETELLKIKPGEANDIMEKTSVDELVQRVKKYDLDAVKEETKRNDFVYLSNWIGNVEKKVDEKINCFEMAVNNISLDLKWMKDNLVVKITELESFKCGHQENERKLIRAITDKILIGFLMLCATVLLTRGL